MHRFKEVLPEEINVTVLADRGFGDTKLYDFLKDDLGFDFVIRFRGNIKVTDIHGETREAIIIGLVLMAELELYVR